MILAMRARINRNRSIPIGRRALTASLLLICIAFTAGPCAAGVISSDLASAGPINWAILAGPKVADFALNGPGTTNGNVGYDGTNTLQLNASGGHQAINGDLFLASGASVNNPAQVTGMIFTNSSFPGMAWSDALSATAVFNALAPNRTINGDVNSSTTIDATGAGTYVVDINGNLGANLTIKGTASDNVIINITGKLQYNSNSVSLSGGLTSSDVVLNFVGSNGGDLQTAGGLNNESVINAIVLATSRNIGFAPGLVNGELIAGGQQLHLVSGASTNEVSIQSSVPEPSTYLLLGGGLLGVWALSARKRAIASTASRSRAS